MSTADVMELRREWRGGKRVVCGRDSVYSTYSVVPGSHFAPGGGFVTGRCDLGQMGRDLRAYSYHIAENRNGCRT